MEGDDAHTTARDRTSAESGLRRSCAPADTPRSVSPRGRRALGFVSASIPIVAWLVVTVRTPGDWVSELPLAAGLATALALTAWRATRDRHELTPRLGPGLAIATVLVLPWDIAGWTLLPACWLAGGGVVGIRRRGRIATVSALAATTGTAAVVELLPVATLRPGAASTLLPIAALWFVAEGSARGLGWLLRDPEDDEPDWLPRSSVAIEGVGVPVAWTLLALATLRSAPVTVPVAAGLVAAAGWAMATVTRADRRARHAQRSLEARVSELATLHSVGKEIVSAHDLARVATLLDRECRKILDVERFSIVVVDPDTARATRLYVRDRGASPTVHRGFLPSEPAPAPNVVPVRVGGPAEPPIDPVDRWVLGERRPFHAPDLSHAGRDGPRIERGAGAVLAVPLLLDDRAIGVLRVESRHPFAFDEHRTGFLTTLAQQAAVAVQSARHYHLATFDSLTGLALRDHFFRRAEEEYVRAARYGSRFAVAMLDLDGFKRVNDRYGHAVGDRVLCEAATAVRAGLRGADLAGRYGGDEISLLLPETGADGAIAIADRLREAIARVVVHADGVAIRTTASIGLALYPGHDHGSLAGLLGAADRALYEAKREGRNRVHLYSSRDERIEPGSS